VGSLVSPQTWQLQTALNKVIAAPINCKEQTLLYKIFWITNSSSTCGLILTKDGKKNSQSPNLRKASSYLNYVQKCKIELRLCTQKGWLVSMLINKFSELQAVYDCSDMHVTDSS
jgi:hypothetical protein